ncbi:MAG: hypothetical protein WC518_03640 [Patescibacteria group bacterium]
MTKFFISNHAAALAAVLAPFGLTASVEAEFGDECVAGSVATLAHHGPRAGNPAPCLADNGAAGEVEAVGLSHLDLDSVGGCAAVLGRKPETPGFWLLAAFVDLNGPHKLGQAGAEPADIVRLYAFWAWSNGHRCLPPRDGSAAEVTEQVMEAVRVVERICADDPELLAAGEAFRSAEVALNAQSFVEAGGGVAVRVADTFVSHLYVDPEGDLAKAVVAFNTVTGAVTVSIADPIPGVSAREIVQGLWGEAAGGHAGIAGSPRGQRMMLADVVAAVEATRAVIAKA